MEEDDMRSITWTRVHRRRFDFVQTVYRSLIVTHVGLGVAILAGGVDRFPFPTYKPLLELTNGSVLPWGLWILASGVLMASHGWWANITGLGAGLLWMNLFSAMFFSAYEDPHSSSTAPIPYMGLAMITVALMTYKIIEHRTRMERYR